jgi:hydroxymethylbilane synthase
LPNKNKSHYKIGTRGSLLALTQCNQVKAELERLTGDTFELVVIKTQGDIITNAPLWQLDGKDFFTKELDEALISGKVDLVVHSYKDLGSIRPDELTLAAITKRTYANDILLIKNETIRDLKNKNEFVLGTSSPRRMVNLEHNLAPFLPLGSHLKVVSKVLRGNVNTRIEKLQYGEYDAIVLALPGIERLALTESSRATLAELLFGMNFMILPESIFPSSAAQGALAMECVKHRTDNGLLISKLKMMEDADTVEEVSRERRAFNEYGGGCHLAVGINVKKSDQFFIHNHRGILTNESEVSTVKISFLEGRDLPQFFVKPRYFSGLPHDDLLVLKSPLQVDLKNCDHLYITSKHCLDAVTTQPKSLWAAGTKSMKDLAAKGFWVNGSADSLGDSELIKLRSGAAIALMVDTKAELTVLTNDQGISPIGSVASCYTRTIVENTDDAFNEKINTTDVFYWTSFFQYQAYIAKFPQIIKRIHVCGLGKTYKHFKEKNINVLPMSTMEEFKTWIMS